jgi:hypothetical protein
MNIVLSIFIDRLLQINAQHTELRRNAEKLLIRHDNA